MSLQRKSLSVVTYAAANATTTDNHGDTGGKFSTDIIAVSKECRERITSNRMVVWGIVFCAILLGLVAWRFEIIATPPYDDQAIGLWAEASFLANTHFDYVRLRYQEHHYTEWAYPDRTGQRVYMISALPTIVAVLMSSPFSSRAVLICTHLMTFACASGIATLMLVVVKPKTGWWAALLLIATLFSVPLFRVQIDMVGMDLPLAFFALASAVAAWHGKFRLAAVLSGVAFMVKATGVAVTATFIVYAVVLLLGNSGANSARCQQRLKHALTWSFLILGCEIGLFLWAYPTLLVEDRLTTYPKYMTFPAALWSTPEIIVLLIVALAGCTYLWYRSWHQQRNRQLATGQRRDPFSILRSFFSVLESEPVLLWSCLIIGGIFSQMALWLVLPRYFTTILPFAFLVLGRLIAKHMPSRIPLLIASIILIGIDLANADGRLYPDIDKLEADYFASDAFVTPRNCAFVERSFEYLHEHRACLELVRILVDHHSDQPVLGPVPFLNYLSDPNLGYVARPFEVYHAGNFSIAMDRFCEKSIPATESGANHTPILIWDRNSRMMLPPPDFSRDEILFYYGGTPPLVMYRKSIPPAVDTLDEMQQWYLDATWHGPWLTMRILARIPWLLEHELYKRCHAEVEQALHEDRKVFAGLKSALGFIASELPVEFQWRQELSLLLNGMPMRYYDRELLFALRELDDGPIRRIELQDSGLELIADMCYVEASRQIATGQLAAARRCLQDAKHPQPALLYLARGRIELEFGNLPLASDLLNRSLALQPGCPLTLYYLGLVKIQQGNYEQAGADLRVVVDKAPNFVEACQALGQALMRLGHTEEANLQFARASQLRRQQSSLLTHPSFEPEQSRVD